jgi:glycolate oxidase iron-sulfur subunit
MRVALMTGCAQKALNTDINDATIRLLRRLGARWWWPRGMGCCGALTHHMGKEDAGPCQRRRQHPRLHGRGGGRGWMPSSSTPAGCGTTVKDYGHMFRNDPTADAATVAGLAKDISELLARLGLPEGAPKGLRVAYHAACSCSTASRSSPRRRTC